MLEATDQSVVSDDMTRGIGSLHLDSMGEREKDVFSVIPPVSDASMMTNGNSDKKSPEVQKTPFTILSGDSQIPAIPKLTESQIDMLKSMHEHFSALPELATMSPAKSKALSTTPITAPLTSAEKFWLTRECFLRYLRATKWNLAEAKKRLESTLIWRREYNIEAITPELIEPEGETGKQIILGYDNAGRPCLYLKPSLQNTKTSPRQIQFLVFALESVATLMPRGVETLSLLVNFKSSSNSSSPSPNTGRQVLSILQNHYPERLGRALVINVPAFVWIFFKLITPFIDPMTREKLKFNEDLRTHVPPAQLDELFGGDCKFEYEHNVYWPALVKLVQERHKEQYERWESLGGLIGTSEYDIKTGNV